MKKFLVLYRAQISAAEQMQNATPEQAKAGMDMWMAWHQKAGDAVVDLGSPLGNTMSVTSGGATSGDDHVGGYSILQADSMDDALKALEGHPHLMLPGASIEVHEVLPMPGM